MTAPNLTPDIGYRWWIGLKNAPALRNRLPIETALSYPVGGENQELHLFHFRVVGEVLVRPKSYLRAVLPSLRILELQIPPRLAAFTQASEKTLWYPPSAWKFPTEKAMLNHLPTLMARYPTLPSAEEGRAYLSLWNQVVSPSLTIFYQALNPHWFAWLEGGV